MNNVFVQELIDSLEELIIFFEEHNAQEDYEFFYDNIVQMRTELDLLFDAQSDSNKKDGYG